MCLLNGLELKRRERGEAARSSGKLCFFADHFEETWSMKDLD